MVFGSWSDLAGIVIVGTGAYAGLVFILRIAGKRMLSKMNAFDLVVSVALGSTLASTVLSSDTSLTEGLTAFAVLCLLQYVSTYTSVRLKWFKSLIKADPTLIYHRGVFLDEAMKHERVTPEEVEAAARGAGCAGLAEVASVVLETDGSFSVMTREVEQGDLFTQVRA